MPGSEGKIESIMEEMLTVYEELNLFYDISSSLIYPPDLEKTLDRILRYRKPGPKRKVENQ